MKLHHDHYPYSFGRSSCRTSSGIDSQEKFWTIRQSIWGISILAIRCCSCRIGQHHSRYHDAVHQTPQIQLMWLWILGLIQIWSANSSRCHPNQRKGQKFVGSRNLACNSDILMPQPRELSSVLSGSRHSSIASVIRKRSPPNFREQKRPRIRSHLNFSGAQVQFFTLNNFFGAGLTNHDVKWFRRTFVRTYLQTGANKP